MRKIALAASMITGTVVGAGILGLPYTFYNSGFLLGCAMLMFSIITSLLLMIYISELDFNIKNIHQIPGLVRHALGKKAGFVQFIVFVLGTYGATTAYTIGVSKILNILFGISAPELMLYYFLFCSALVFFGLKVVGKAEFILSTIVISIILFLSAVVSAGVNPVNLSGFKTDNLMLSYGVILFSCLGVNIIPEVNIYLREDKRRVKLSIITAMVICFVIYFFFAYSFSGAFGSNIHDIAIDNLKGKLLILGSVFACLSMTSAYLSLGLTLRDSFMQDYSIKSDLFATLFTTMPSLLIAIFMNPGFVNALSFTGAYVASIEGILIALAVLKQRKKYKMRLVKMGSFPLYMIMFVFSLVLLLKTYSLLM